MIELLKLMAVQESGGGGSGYRPPTSSGSSAPPSSSGSSGSQQAAAYGANQGTDDDEPETEEERYGNQFFWQDAVVERIQDDISALAKKYDIDLDFVQGWFDGQQLNLIDYLSDTMNASGARGAGPYGITGDPTGTPGGMNNLFALARSWMAARFPFFREGMEGLNSGSGSGRGRGSGGARGPTPDQIRAQFDIDELTEAANTIWRGMVLEEAPAARALAKAYVETIVANPEQKVDFESYILKNVRNTARYKVIYRNKPQSMTEQQFIQPIFQMVQQTLGAGFDEQAADITINQARLGTNPAQLQQRLMREDQVQTSAPFLQNLGERLSGFRKVLN